MGLVGAIVGTLGTAFLAGRAQQQQYEAAAAQARTNAQLQAQEAEVAQQNALKANKQAEETARVVAQNVEDETRRARLRINQQLAEAGHRGVQGTTGSAGALIDESDEEIKNEQRKRLANGMQDSYKWFGIGTDYANQSNKFKWQEANYRKTAKDYEAAGNRAFWGSMLGGLLNVGTSLAGGLYSSKSSAMQSANGSTVGGYLYNSSGNSIAGNILGVTSPSRTWNFGKR